MTKRNCFACPVCNGHQYNSLTGIGNREPTKVSVYACTCCGFTFLDPKRYRQVFTPYSTLRH